MKYMVMECHRSYAVVLDENGRFLKVANICYAVGQTVTDVIEMQMPQPQKSRRIGHRWIYALSTIAACLILAVASVFQRGQAPYASVYMRINPEVRIDVDQEDVVVGLESLNEEGRQLLADYRYQKKDLGLVMEKLIDRAVDRGYLYAGGQVTLMLDGMMVNGQQARAMPLATV